MDHPVFQFYFTTQLTNRNNGSIRRQEIVKPAYVTSDITFFFIKILIFVDCPGMTEAAKYLTEFNVIDIRVDEINIDKEINPARFIFS
jgi:hypothetical protein